MPRARVVLVHGLRTSATMWRRQLAALARHDIEAMAIDLPGHGARLDELFTIDDALRVIGEALPPAAEEPSADDHVPTLLVGLSLGGYLAIEFAARHPGRVDGLVAASCGIRPRGVGLAGYRRIAAAIAHLPDHGRALNDFTARLFLPPDGAEDVIAGGVGLDAMAPVLGTIGGLDTEGALARIDVPIWFVNGRLDHFRIEERRLLRAARRGRLVHIPGATHLVSLVRPEAFTAVVLAAVAELELDAARARRRRRIGAPGT
jgi:pimeloyl-ACP methyl ester carboxylesterase